MTKITRTAITAGGIKAALGASKPQRAARKVAVEGRARHSGVKKQSVSELTNFATALTAAKPLSCKAALSSRGGESGEVEEDDDGGGGGSEVEVKAAH